MRKLIRTVLVLALLGGAFYAVRIPLEKLFARLQTTYTPCAYPITYTVGSFDPRFGISKQAFLDAIRSAEAIWETPIHKNLFDYAPAGGALTVNLIYDYRQEATARLQKLGLTVNEDTTSYDTLKAKYDALRADYTQKKTAYESRLVAFNERKRSYDAEVAMWNRRGGAPRDVYAELGAEKTALDAEYAELERMRTDLNAEVDDINALVVVLNRIVAALNLDVAQFNEIGAARGGEFEEGTYSSGPEGAAIDIYEFSSTAKLVRVLAHELGHALGLEHVSDPKAIMYRLNQGTNEKLTAADIAELKNRCGIK